MFFLTILFLALFCVAGVCNSKMKAHYPMEQHFNAAGTDWGWVAKSHYSESDFFDFRLMHATKWCAIGVATSVAVVQVVLY